MFKKIQNIIEKSEDENLEFDNRYTATTKDKIKKRKKHYQILGLFEKFISENKRVIKEMQHSKNRAKAMNYYDELFTTNKAFKELSALKKKGKKIIGTFCNMVPEELIYAADAIPIRLCSGCNEAVKPAEEAYPRDACPLIKASFGFAVADCGFFNLCDAVIIPSTCDGKKKLGEMLNDYVYVWMMNLPQDKERNLSKKYWLSETRILKKRLEELTGKSITRKKLKQAILLLHKRDDLVRRLMKIRKSNMPNILGSDAFLVIQAAFFDNIERWIKKTHELCTELETSIKHEKRVKPKQAIRILVTGAPMILPNFKVPDIIESLNAFIAMDETCAGSQYVYDPVEVDEWNTLDMMRAISERYLMPSMCPCFIKAEDRIDKLINMIKEYRIDAVVYHTLRLCLLFDIESLKIRDVMEEQGIPFLHINTDYGKEDKEQLRTRIEAFIELVEARK
ncbi:2-hydroxyacyl-CoA dehydratase family protein [Candidatus Woesearchaeota archaeon]|nr:2-hydroxyacyl-CoA dehydratase family protein [Candidatus Woesearchaeota archaeon]